MERRHGPVEAFSIEELLPKLQSFGGLPVYDWEFFDVAEKEFASLELRLRFDLVLGGSSKHSLSLLQEGHDRHLDLWLWFDSLHIFSAVGHTIELGQQNMERRSR